MFYDLESAAKGQLETVAAVSNEQLKDPTSQKTFRLKHLAVNGSQFPRCNFDTIGLRRFFGSGTRLLLTGV